MGGVTVIKLLGRLALIAGFAWGLVAPLDADAQATTWSYSAPNNVATATYPGNVTILGSCTGCAAGGVRLDVPQTWTATQTFAGSNSTLGLVAPNIGETVAVTAAAPATTQAYDMLSASVELYTVAASANWTLNLRGNGSTSLNAALAVGQSVTVALLATQGATPFYNSAVQVDGVSVTPKWQGGAPSAGNASGIDVYTYTVIKTGSAAFTVLATLAAFK
jgi:hypothetical protein